MLLPRSFEDPCFSATQWPSKLKAILQDLNYTLLECPQCTLIYQQYAWENHEASVVYGRFENTEDLDRPTPIEPLAHKAEDAMIMRLLSKEQKPKGFDYGMGPGQWALMAKAYGCEVAGYDIDPR